PAVQPGRQPGNSASRRKALKLFDQAERLQSTVASSPLYTSRSVRRSADYTLLPSHMTLQQLQQQQLPQHSPQQQQQQQQQPQIKMPRSGPIGSRPSLQQMMQMTMDTEAEGLVADRVMQ
uniref:TORC_N domain-containing protein n=1 Tax=Macrostomum lignano TaxID=282301 RepID=A0A1I8GY62_9PLAT